MSLFVENVKKGNVVFGKLCLRKSFIFIFYLYKKYIFQMLVNLMGWGVDVG